MCSWRNSSLELLLNFWIHARSAGVLNACRFAIEKPIRFRERHVYTSH